MKPKEENKEEGGIPIVRRGKNAKNYKKKKNLRDKRKTK